MRGQEHGEWMKIWVPEAAVEMIVCAHLIASLAQQYRTRLQFSQQLACRPDELWPVLMRYVWWVFLRRGTVPFPPSASLLLPLSLSYTREVHGTWRHHQRMLWKNNSRNLAAAPPVGERRQHGIDRCRKRYCSNDDVIKPKLSPVRLRNCKNGIDYIFE